MIRLQELVLSRGGRELLRGANASISPGERVALIGLNGSGKTSLLAALAGETFPDAGSIDQPFSRVTRLEQSLPVSDLPAWRYLVGSDTELSQAQQGLELAQQAADNQSAIEAASDAGMALAQAHARWLEAGGTDAPARARALLFGLGFSDNDAEAPVNALSGGWRMRLNLARALFAPCDLLLLDEPTNHLDLDAIIWLERWLVRLPSTQIIISHDRDFLDRVVRASLQIDEAQLIRYAGGYSEFERLRAERQMQVSRERASAAQRVQKLEGFINRFRAQANRARQVQSRIKALERMAQMAPVRALRGIDIEIPSVGECPEPLVVADALNVGYGDKAVVRHVRLQIGRGARLGILGRNGAGKSTLIRTLVGELPPISGELQVARSLRVGYFAQQGVETLRPDDSALNHMQRAAPAEREQVLRDFLGRFGFGGEDATRPVGPMSGGEKARLLLALLIWHKPQFLVLDEPTNHLDAQTRDALADALAEFDGAMLLVSHDRYLLRATVDRLLLVDEGQLSEYDGDLDDYYDWTVRRRSKNSEASASDARRPSASDDDASAGNAQARTESGPSDRRAERRQAAERRAALAQRTKPLDAEIGSIEARIGAMDKELADIETALQDPAIYAGAQSANRLSELGKRRATLLRDKEAAEARWFDLQTEREAILEDAARQAE